MKGLEFSLAQMCSMVLLLFMVTIGIIFMFKSRFKQFKNLTLKYKDKIWKSPLEARTKYPDVDGFAFHQPFLLWGFLSATSLVLFAINLTQKTMPTRYQVNDNVWNDELELETKIFHFEEQRQLPKIPQIRDIILDETVEEDIVFEDLMLSPTETNLSIGTSEKAKDIPAVPPPPKIEEPAEIVLLFSEQMPRFPGCENTTGDSKLKEVCSKEKLLKYLYDNVRYPQIAKEVGVEGTAVVQFTVNKNGAIENINVLRDPGSGLGDAAKAVISSMNKMKEKWTPGKQRGVNVSVRYTLPIKFKLNQ